MTKKQFAELPALLKRWHVEALGYDRRTLAKFVDAGVLVCIQMPGLKLTLYQKRQMAQLVGWADVVELAAFQEEPPLMKLERVKYWTGLPEETLAKLVSVGILRRVKPPGASYAKFLKETVAALVGMRDCV